LHVLLRAGSLNKIPLNEAPTLNLEGKAPYQNSYPIEVSKFIPTYPRPGVCSGLPPLRLFPLPARGDFLVRLFFPALLFFYSTLFSNRPSCLFYTRRPPQASPSLHHRIHLTSRPLPWPLQLPSQAKQSNIKDIHGE